MGKEESRELLTAREQKLLDAIEPVASENDVEVVTVEVIGAKKSPVVRVYIDAEGGVSFQELTSAQEWLGELMDRIDPFPGAYTLEVSSPGIDRPLRTPEHFARFVGEEARIRCEAPVDGLSNFKGVLASADDDAVTIEADGVSHVVPYGNIRRANLVGKVEF